ncbi:unnamed protein product [Spirodela intermedia]|uniref:Transketolase-like pyrimidine-binding domain-containing protein n=2 Tax=Spirodela intermedia TaxID=51605 RepID=A0A7I8IZT3_SPIIN|nr:unnamed protein product [Spirodela intermedia]CAA6663397.1 unnamed protein product [Spirodela intermedia]CAA7399859.1 unnamed protein product [Spirodela intermedia]
MGCAPMGQILYDEVMRYNPKNPYWFNRDRFVLSTGHGCMLQYALLHLAGYDSVKQNPGHPENFETPGVEVTTGPLGQGIANAVGLALAEKHLAARFNKPDDEIVNHYTYVILGDGCQIEGISNEACSLAGHWGLGKLIAFYDDSHISIDGDTEIAFTEDVSARFKALGWHTIWIKNGNTGYDEIRAAIAEAKAVTDKPTLIKLTTTIGFGSPNKANSYAVHGSALGAKEVDATRQNLGWPYEPFHVPEDVQSHWSRHVPEGAALEAEWNAKFAEYENKYEEETETLKGIISGSCPTYNPESICDATRNLSQQCLIALAKVLPGLLGGSADLASSNMTLLKMFGDFQKDTPEERNVRFGVREHGMGAICNGIGLHSPGLIPYCATFFVFTDYMRAAMRISALCEAGLSTREGRVHRFRQLRRRQARPHPPRHRLGAGDRHQGSGGAEEGGKKVRVVSLVSWELFDEQTEEYKESVLPGVVTARVSYVGSKGKAVGIDHFGSSAPAGTIYKEFGISTAKSL